jgi:hypothetical protein
MPEGQRVQCYPTCATQSDCRMGYYCDRTAGGFGFEFSDGLCLPANCDMASMPCPLGYHCIDANPTHFGSCAPDG